MHAASYLLGMLKREDVEVVGVADENAERVRPYSVDRGIPYYADYNELLAQELDAVVICSENARHAEFTKLAARRVSMCCAKAVRLVRVRDAGDDSSVQGSWRSAHDGFSLPLYHLRASGEGSD